MVYVIVPAGNGEAAIRTLKRKMQKELIFATMKKHRHYESPSERKVRKSQESHKRVIKARRSFGSRRAEGG